MNILLLYTHNPVATSGVIPMDLMHEFTQKGHHVKLIVNSYAPDYPAGLESMETSFRLKKNNFIKRVKAKLGLDKTIATDPKYHFFELNEEKSYYKTKDILKKAGFKPDVIILFFVKGFLNTKNVYELNKLTSAPVYWLLYDMAPLTGGCHYAWECTGYQKNCGSCPGLYSSDPHDISFRNLAYKKEYLDKTNLHVVTASEWVYKQAHASTLFKHHPIHKILTSFNRNIFKPVDKKEIRTKHGIDPNKKIIFFGAFRMFDERKGMQYLLKSLHILKDRVKNTPLGTNILLLVAGTGFDKIKDSLPFAYHNMGMLDNSYGIASAYQLTDIFLCPSVEDSGPTMINQSIMCGTPVVSFDMGIAPDLVINGKTGYRAKLKDSDDMANGMVELLSMSELAYTTMSENCRQLALEQYDQSVNIEKWLNILNNKK